jgi:hypothetical protein
MKKRTASVSKSTKKSTAGKPKRKSEKSASEKPLGPTVRTIKTLGKVGTISLARIRAAVKAVAAQEKRAFATGNTSSES